MTTTTLQINLASGVNPEHLDYFKFIGCVLSLAVFHHRFLNAYFVPGFYTMALNKKVNLKDLEAVVRAHRRGRGRGVRLMPLFVTGRTV